MTHDVSKRGFCPDEYQAVARTGGLKKTPYSDFEKKMTLEKQVEIIEAQLSNFDSLMEKMQYMAMMFDPDPQFTKEARDIVRGNICKTIAK